VSGDRRRDWLEQARLYLIVEARVSGRPVDEVVAPALEGGVDIVQLRDKHAPDAEIVAAGERLRELCTRHGALLIVNDRPDLALLCGADGVHVGQEDEPAEPVRATVGPELIVGVSTHSPRQIESGVSSAADYLGVGPVFGTATKPHVAPVGLELVTHAAAHARKPWFAIGGIDLVNAPRVVAAGARRVAVVRAIRDSTDPRSAARGLRDALDREPVPDGIG
jgi:thiamine-phosphate pyrophosphorylase